MAHTKGEDMNHGQDTVNGEVIRSLCDQFESLLDTYHSHTTATGGKYDSPEMLLESLIENLRNEAPEPESEEDPERDEEQLQHWEIMDRDNERHQIEMRKEIDAQKLKRATAEEKEERFGQNIQTALEDEGDSI